MKNYNQAHPTNKKPFKALAAASAFAVAASGIGMSNASASTRPSQKPAISGAIRESSPRSDTPFQVLTGIVAKLDKGDQAKVTAHAIELPGPIETAQGQPIVFNADHQTYFAYTQDQEPNFNQKRPADVAGDMAIVKEPIADVNVALEEAHLDKTGILVDTDQMAVGYSVGGNNGK